MAADAVLLDLDGTVWDSWPWYARCIGRGQAAAGARAEKELRTGASAASLLRGAGGERWFRRWCEAESAELCLYDGAVRTLKRLQRRGRPLGAVTNLPGWIAGPMLEATGLVEVFGSVVTYVRPPKPQPLGLLRAIGRLDVKPSPAAWYIGDTLTDQQAARRAGVSFAWASWGYAADSLANCDRKLATFSELLDL